MIRWAVLAVCVCAPATTLKGQTARVMRTVVAPAETLHVSVWGEGDPVVIVPGIWSSTFAFRKVIPQLRERDFRVIIVEPLGVGFSSRPSRADYSMTAQARRIAAVLDSLGVKRATFVGQALSASMLMRIALNSPARVNGLVSLEGGATDVSATPGLRRGLRIASLVFKVFPSTALLRRRLKGSMEEVSGDRSWITPDVVEGYLTPWRNRISATIDAYRAMAASSEHEPLVPKLEQLRIPVNLVVGMASHYGGVSAAEFAAMEAIPLYTVTRVPRIGHLIHEERPGEVIAAVLRMRQRAEASR